MKNNLTTIQKVLLLQEADVFEYTASEDLAKIATLSSELLFEEGEEIYREGDLSDSMYMVIAGRVKIHRNQQEITTIGAKRDFGAWSLFDDEVRVVTATTLEKTHLLKIEKDDFFDLLSENLRITQGILKKFSRRLRGVMTQVQGSNGK